MGEGTEIKKRAKILNLIEALRKQWPIRIESKLLGKEIKVFLS